MGVVAFAATLIATACQSAPVIPPSAVVELTQKDCAEAVSLTDALDLTPEKKKKWIQQQFKFDETTACAQVEGVPVNYTVYELPALAPKHTFTVGGAKSAVRTLGARVVLLDGEGEIVREFADEKYMDIKHTYGVQFRPRENEKFILVHTDAGLVGEAVHTTEQILTTTQYQYATAAGGGIAYVQSGYEKEHARTYSHEGSLFIGIQAVSGYIGLPD